MNNKAIFAGVVSFVSGAAVGYFLGKRNGSVTVVPPSDEPKSVVPDNQLVLPLYDLSAEDNEVLPPIDWSVISPVTSGPTYTGLSAPPSSRGIVVTNVFEDAAKIMAESLMWDEDAEQAEREGKDAYVIHVDEFYDNDNDFPQGVITYYAGDDVAVDETDTPIFNHKTLLGELKFGHGSNESAVVYIRNVAVGKEFEVHLDEGLYQVEVLGYDVQGNELKHSLYKFRPTD